MINIIGIPVLVLLVAFLLPFKISIKTNIKGENVYNVDNSGKDNEIAITLKIFNFLPVYRFKSNRRKMTKKKKKEQDTTVKHIVKAFVDTVKNQELKITDLTSKLLEFTKRIKFNKFILVGGLNTNDYVKNSYIVSSINTIICMIINSNSQNFNFNKLYYQVGISDYSYYLIVDTDFSFPAITNIYVFYTIIRYVINLKKEKKLEREKVMKKYRKNTYLVINRKYDLT